MPSAALKFKGHKYLRQRLVLAIISGKTIRIDGIRSKDKDPGLRGRFCSDVAGVYLNKSIR